MPCFNSPRTRASSPLFFSIFPIPYPFISWSLHRPATRSGAPLSACPRHLPVSMCRPLGLSSIASLPSFAHSSGDVMWRLLLHSLFIFLHLSCPSCWWCVCLVFYPTPPPNTLWHLFCLIAWLVCVSLLSWMDWFCLLITKSKPRVIRKTRWSKPGLGLTNQIAEDFSLNPSYHQIY